MGAASRVEKEAKTRAAAIKILVTLFILGLPESYTLIRECLSPDIFNHNDQETTPQGTQAKICKFLAVFPDFSVFSGINVRDEENRVLFCETIFCNTK